MQQAHLIRLKPFPTCTLGLLVLGDLILPTLERPWMDNQRNISAIPAGTHQATFLKRSASGRYRNVWQLHDVPGRSGILIHAGNTVDHTKGCILIGRRFGTLNEKPAVLNSHSALQALNRSLKTRPFQLTIHQE